jgi:hypothetical protein
MFNKIKLLLLMFLLAAAVAACAKNAPTQAQSSPTVTIWPSPAPDESQTPTTPPTEPTQEPTVDSGYFFTYNSAKISVTLTPQQLFDILGEPMDIYETPSCAGFGTDRLLYFPGITVTTFVDEDTSKPETVSSITLTDDNNETAEKIFIGSTRTDVEKAYGSPFETYESGSAYVQGKTRLMIIFEGDDVAEISYQAVDAVNL